ncbi:hypothetical protein [Caballeronia zhejiangensis]|uniref:hypothetical protein n=1 Tax=Caballeronia zhejiangensis TaxID=871203 RepID=UPI00158C50A6|nr:hypothetical protein [Caballeronia zhejiangensis]
MTNELKLRMTEIARKWMRPDSEAAPEFHWGDFYDCVAEIIGAAGASEGQAVRYVIDEQSALGQSLKHIERQDATIAALRERIAGMEKDAARYMWLKHFGGDYLHWQNLKRLESDEEFDAYVDAGIAKSQK